MFGMGGTEILVILIVALLFLGPDKLPDAARSISKGIRDIKKQSRVLQRTIEDDEHIGGAIRDLKSALRGEDEPIRPPKPRKQLDAPFAEAGGFEAGATAVGALDAGPVIVAAAAASEASDAAADAGAGGDAGDAIGEPGDATTPAAPGLTMPPTAGEPDDSVAAPSADDDAALAALVKPAPNTIAQSPRPPASNTPGSKQG